MDPLIAWTGREKPSGAAVVSVISHQNSLTTPVSGASSYQLVDKEYSPQQVGLLAESNSHVWRGEISADGAAVATEKRALRLERMNERCILHSCRIWSINEWEDSERRMGRLLLFDTG